MNASLSAVYVFGAKRANHGTYEASVDGAQSLSYSGFSEEDLFQQMLFAATGLDEEEHEVASQRITAWRATVALC
jgi:hypothetical protein